MTEHNSSVSSATQDSNDYIIRIEDSVRNNEAVDAAGRSTTEMMLCLNFINDAKDMAQELAYEKIDRTDDGTKKWEELKAFEEAQKNESLSRLLNLYFKNSHRVAEDQTAGLDSIDEDTKNYKAKYEEIILRTQADREKIIAHGANLSVRDKVKLAVLSSMTISSLSPSDQTLVYKSLGYTENEAVKVTKDIAFSLGLSAPLGAAYEALGLAAAGIGVLHPIVGDASDPKAIALGAMSYLGYWVASAASIETNVHWVKQEGRSLNGTGAVAYHILRKVAPTKSNVQDWGTRAASVGMELWKEGGWWSTLLIPDKGPSMFVYANATGIVLNTLQAIATKAYLVKKNSVNDEG